MHYQPAPADQPMLFTSFKNRKKHFLEEETPVRTGTGES
jgi:hypothetical protein